MRARIALDHAARGVEHVGAERAVRARQPGARRRQQVDGAAVLEDLDVRVGARAVRAARARSRARWCRGGGARGGACARPRGRARSGPSSRSKPTPALTSASIVAGPRSTTKRTTSSRHSPAPARERVLDVRLEGVLVRDHGGDAALGEVGGRVGGALLGDDRDAARGRPPGARRRARRSRSRARESRPRARPSRAHSRASSGRRSRLRPSGLRGPEPERRWIPIVGRVYLQTRETHRPGPLGGGACCALCSRAARGAASRRLALPLRRRARGGPLHEHLATTAATSWCGPPSGFALVGRHPQRRPALRPR